jgi:hypothetical protein
VRCEATHVDTKSISGFNLLDAFLLGKGPVKTCAVGHTSQDNTRDLESRLAKANCGWSELVSQFGYWLTIFHLAPRVGTNR